MEDKYFFSACREQTLNSTTRLLTWHCKSRGTFTDLTSEYAEAMSPPGVDPLNEQLGMEAVQRETQPKINKGRALWCQDLKYGTVSEQV